MSASEVRTQLGAVAAEVAKLLKEAHETVAFVETAAGGLVQSSLLEQPGASAFFRGGVIAYSLECRTAFLDWSEQDTADYRGPSIEIVTKLAKSVQRKLGSTWAVSESGAAGPTRPDKYRSEITVGYCPIAVIGPNGVHKTRELNTNSSDRSQNMLLFAIASLELLRDALQGRTT